LDVAFEVMDYPIIQLVFELVPNNSVFLASPESSSRRIKTHRIRAECILEARKKVWNQGVADSYIHLHVQDTEEDDTLSAGGNISDADPYRYNFIQARDCVMYFDRVNYREEEQLYLIPFTLGNLVSAFLNAECINCCSHAPRVEQGKRLGFHVVISGIWNNKT
jgi:hypothetical protein